MKTNKYVQTESRVMKKTVYTGSTVMKTMYKQEYNINEDGE